MWFFSQGLILEMIQVIVMPWELAIHRSCRFIVSPWISPAWIRTFLYKSFKLMVLPWISWPWNSFVWHFNFLGSLALPFTEFAGSWCPHEFLLRELELFCTKVSRSWFYQKGSRQAVSRISWPWISLVWHLKFPWRLAFAEVTGLCFPHEFLLCELELLFAKVAWSWSMWFLARDWSLR